MAIFPFFQKSDNSKDPLAELPLFSGVDDKELKAIRKQLRLLEFKKGEIVYEQGGPPDAFYILVSGRLRASKKNRDGSSQTVAFFHRGDSFGDSSILSDSPHSVTVQVVNDCIVYKMDKEVFSDALKQYSSLSFQLTRRLSINLKNQRLATQNLGETEILSVFSMQLGLGRTTFIVNFATSLIREAHKRVVVVDLNPLHGSQTDRPFEVKINKPDLDLSKVESEKVYKDYIDQHRFGFYQLNVKYREDCSTCDKKIITLLAYLIDQYNYVLLKLPYKLGPVSIKALSQSDKIYLISQLSSQGIGRCRQFIHELLEKYQFQHAQVKLVMSESGQVQSDIVKLREKLVQHQVYATLPLLPQMTGVAPDAQDPLVVKEPGTEYSRVVRSLARDAAGIFVGLALGSGAAFGIAHIGVIRVLERENIPIDIVAGSSMGSVIAIFWAAGFDSYHMEKTMMELSGRRNAFWKLIGLRDFSLPHHGFFKGKRIIEYLKSHLGEKTFRDLRIPALVTAMNLFSKEEYIFEEGKVVDALRASISIPGIFRPYERAGTYFIDGGVVDPVPVTTLANEGVKKIIAVNVLQGPRRWLKEYAMEKNEQTKKTQSAMTVKGMGDRLAERYEKNVFNVLMNTIQTMEHRISTYACSEADVVINPVIQNSSWVEFFHPRKFIEIGMRETEKHLDEIKQLVKEG